MACGVVAVGGGHELFDGGDGADAATSAGVHAIHGGGGAGELHLAIKRPGMVGTGLMQAVLNQPGLEQAVDEASVEYVVCAGGVDDGDFECRGVGQSVD